MSAPDFYFGVNAMFRHLHDRFGKPALVAYWRALGREYYRHRSQRWRSGAEALAADWKDYFSREPQADVVVNCDRQRQTVELDIRVCPAIKHLRDNGRDIVDYFCEHCDHVTTGSAAAAGFGFRREGGMGACRQHFTPLTVSAGERR